MAHLDEQLPADEASRMQPLAKNANQFALKFQVGSNQIEKWNGVRNAGFPSLMDEAHYLGRISGHNRIRGNIFGDDAAGAHNRVLADGGVGKNRSAGADGCTLLDDRRFYLPVVFGLQVPFSGRSARIAVVQEHDSVSDEDIVLNDDAFTDKGVTGDLAAFADAGILLDFNERADLCLVPDLASV